jgi:DNA-binding NarL/FixJ family response regulator
MTTTVLLVDDHPVFLSGLRATFADTADIEVVGAVQDGQAAIDAVGSLAPNVVLMDLRMAPMNGIEATRRISTAHPHTAVVVLTMLEDDESVFAAMAAGARGYLVKGASQERIIDAVRSVAAGELVFGQAVADQVLAFFADERRRTRGAFPGLTDREREVLEMLAAGRSNQAIARSLFLSEKTVRNNVSSIFAKLHVADRSEAIVRAREAGYGTPGQPAGF